MAHYLLSTYAVSTAESEPDTGGSRQEQQPPDPQAMQEMMRGVMSVEAEMDRSHTFVFGGHLHGPEATTVVRADQGGVVMTDGPFAESKEHLAGFYIIDAEHLDAALEWARKVSDCIGHPIEVRPFGGTGRMADQTAG